MFGELTYAVNDRFNLTGGLRWYDFEEDRVQTFDGIFAAPGRNPGSTTADGFAPRRIMENVERGVTRDLGEIVLFDGAAISGRIVGPDETDAQQGWISLDSPMARALLGRSVGDDATVPRPRGTAEFVVLAIRYQDPTDSPAGCTSS